MVRPLFTSGSLSLGAVRKINGRINEDGSEWRLGGSWLFKFGIVNFSFIGGSKGSESYSGVWGGVGISYRITENQSLNSFAFVSDDNYGRVEKISLGYTYEFGK